MEPVTVFRSYYLTDADMVRSRLEAAGFTAEVIHDTAAIGTEGFSMAVGGVKVQVPEEQAADARAFLEAKNEE
jgi:hypothetical protein